MRISINRNKHVVMQFSFAEEDIFRKRLLISKGNCNYIVFVISIMPVNIFFFFHYICQFNIIYYSIGI